MTALTKRVLFALEGLSVLTKRILFAIVGLSLLGVIGYLYPEVQHFMGMFALGWMMMDIAQAIFPEVK